MLAIFIGTALGLLVFAVFAAIQEFTHWREDRVWSRKADYVLRSALLPLESTKDDSSS